MKFKRLDSTQPETLRFHFEGRSIAACPGESIASALLRAGEHALRHSARGRAPHGAYCVMGACFECLVEIDGVGKRQACMTAVDDGLVVRRG